MQLDGYIAKTRERFQKLEEALASFDFSDSSNNEMDYGELTREYQRLKELLDLHEEWQETGKQLEDNREMLATEDDEEFLQVVRSEIEVLSEKYEKLEKRIKQKILPPLANEGRNIIIEIRPAAGGDEAGLFAGDLFRMYSRFAEQRNWKVELLEYAESEMGGVRSAFFSVQGEEVFRYMRFESGVHRVQRVPVTESGGRIHTSTVTVAVLPEAESVEVDIDPNELRIDVFKASGPGGQSVNTTESAVRITHLPTGVVVSSQQEKSQHRNREIGMRILRSRILQIKQEEEDAKNAEERRQQVGSGDRSERIRTYNFSQNRVSDHRYNVTRYDLTNILEGNLGELLEQLLTLETEERLATEMPA